MTTTTARVLTILGSEVRIGDIIDVGGNPHRVVDVRAILVGGRRRFQFADGNAYVLGGGARVKITRTLAPARGRLNAPQRRPRPHAGDRAC
ncbi:hypothetical protein [Streptomyces sp. x-80]|uniref:hypothetical protein n=1 Tax=Streptomyces sp. x-80 TaxID=2789282 RepID=UPI00398103F3